MTIGAEFDTPIRVLPDLDIPSDQFAVLGRVVQQVRDAVIPHSQRLAHPARLAPREHQIKILVSPEWAVSMESALWWLCEARVVICHEGRRVDVQLVHRPAEM